MSGQRLPQRSPQFRQRRHDLHGFQAKADDLAEQAHDVLGVVGALDN